MPRISIIIPTFNRALSIIKSISSVLNQTFPDFELIMVDDGSNDDTPEILQHVQDNRLNLIYQQHNGVSAARNTGIEASQSQWIAFLDSDDEWHPSKLQEQIDFHQKHSYFSVSQTQEIWIRNGRFVNPMKKHLKPDGYIFPQSLELCTITPSSAMIKKEILDQVGLFDETMPACEDYDLWLRISARHQIGLIDKPLLTKTGGHPDQLSRQFPAMDRYRIFSMLKVCASGILDDRQKIQLESVCRKKLDVLISGMQKRNQDTTEFGQLAEAVFSSGLPYDDVVNAGARLLLDESRFRSR